MKITLSVYLLSQLKIFTVVLRLWGRTVQGQGESRPEGETSWGWGRNDSLVANRPDGESCAKHLNHRRNVKGRNIFGFKSQWGNWGYSTFFPNYASCACSITSNGSWRALFSRLALKPVTIRY